MVISDNRDSLLAVESAVKRPSLYKSFEQSNFHEDIIRCTADSIREPIYCA